MHYSLRMFQQGVGVETTQIVIGIGEILVICLAFLGGMFTLHQLLVREIKSLDTKLSGEIKEVRQASETAHKEIISRLGDIEKVQATHTERFNTVDSRINCIEDKVDGIQRRLDRSE